MEKKKNVYENVTGYRGAVLHFFDDPDGPGSGKTHEYIEDGLLLVREGRVAALAPHGELSANLPEGTEITDYRGKLIIPGFVDTHVHYPQADAIASYGKQLLDWLETYTFPLEGEFGDRVRAEEAADFFLSELAANGTTTALVMCTKHKASADVFLEKSRDKNLRMIAGKMLMDRNAPDYLLDSPEEGYEDSLALMEKWHGKGRLSYAVTPRFAPTSTEAQLEAAGALLKKADGLYLHTHLSENREEIKWVSELFPWSRSYLDVYRRFGLVGKRSVFAHAIHLDAEDYALMNESSATISFCPTSNLFIGSGLFDLGRAEGAPIPVGMGTDVGGGTSFSMLKTLAEAYKILQLKGQNLSPLKAFYLATLGGARSLDLDASIGNFETGKEADFTVLNFNATPLIKRRAERASSLAEKLFILIILGDDRSVSATHIMGNPVYQKTNRF